MQVGELFVKIGADLGGLTKGIQEAQGKLSSIGQGMVGAGKKLTLGLTAPLVALGGMATKTAIDFDTSMRKVQAVSGATGGKFNALSEQARQLGRDTQFSASEAAEGMQYLSMAGFGVNEVMEAMPGMLDLAAAGALDLGDAADIASNILTGFGMKANEIGHVGDVLSYAAKESNTNVQGLGYAMKYVAPVAQSAGLSLEEMTAAVGRLSDAGMQGEQAGTILRGAISRLLKPSGEAVEVLSRLGLTVEDVDPTMHSFAEILDTLNDAGMDTADAMTVFGQQAGPGMLALLKTGGSGLRQFTNELKNADGTAKDMSNTIMSGPGGALKTMEAALESAKIAVGDIIARALIPLVRTVTRVASAFSELPAPIQSFVVTVAGIGAAIGPITLAIGGFLILLSKIPIVLPKIIAGFAVLKSSTALLGTAFAALTSPAALAVMAIGAIGVNIYRLVKHLQTDAMPNLRDFGDVASESTNKAVNAYMRLDHEAGAALMNLNMTGQKVTQGIAENIGGKFTEMAQQTTDALKQGLDQTTSVLETHFENNKFMAEDEKQAILQGVRERYDEQIQSVEEGEARIQEILNTAAEERRQLRVDEWQEINTLREQMREQAISALSETEAEFRAIQSRISETSREMQAEEVAAVIRHSLDKKNAKIQAANEEYEQVIAMAEQQYHGLGNISEEEYQKIKTAAKKKRDAEVSEAEKGHDEVVSVAEKKLGDQSRLVDTETGEMRSKWSAFWTGLGDIVSSGGITVGQKVSALGTSIGEVFSNVTVNASTWGYNMMANLVGGITSAASFVVQAAISIGTAIGNFFIGLAGTAITWGGNLARNIGSGISGAVDRATQAARTVGQGIRRVFTSLAEKALGWGKNIVKGVADGINDFIHSAIQAASNLSNAIKDTVTGILGIRSPSKVMEQYGRYVAQGLAKGMQEEQTEAEKAAERMTRAITDAAQTMTTDLSRALELTIAELEVMEDKLELEAEAIGEEKAELKQLELEHRKILARKQELQYRIEILTAAFERSRRELGLNNETTKKYAHELSQAQIELKKTEVAVTKTTREIENQRKSISKAISEMARDLQSLYNQVGQVRKRYSKDLSAAADEYFNKVAEVNRRVRDEERQTTQAYWDAVDERTKALSNFVGLFDEAFPSHDVIGRELLENLRGQVKTFELWEKDINELAARGVDQGLIAELKEMGPKAQPEISALLTLTDEQLTEYVALWRRKNQAAREEATKQLRAQRRETQWELIQIRMAAAEELEKYRREWEEKNAEIRKNAQEELDTIQEEFEKIAEAGTRYGIDLMANFTSGMRSQFDSLRATLMQAGAIVDAYMPHSPAKRGYLKKLDEWGPALVKGFADGIAKSTPMLERAMAGMTALTPAAMGAGAVSTSNANYYGGNTFHIHVEGKNERDQARNIMRELHRLGVKI